MPSITPSQIPDNDLTTEFTVPSINYPTEESVLRFRGYKRELDSKGSLTNIGSGAFGVVYIVVNVTDGTKYACKQISLTQSSQSNHNIQRNEQIFNDFKNEIYTLAKVKHKNIISLIDHFIINNKSYIIMELAVGSLHNEVHSDQWIFNERLIKTYFSQIVLALNHLHRLKIAHKDLKLQNILICLKNDTKILKLTDFGLSRVAFKQEKLQRNRRGEGTLPYMSPQILKLYLRNKLEDRERLKLGKFVDYDPFVADIWALGVCLYVMVNKIKPFKQSKDLQILNNVLNNQLKRNYRPIKPKISKQLKDLIDSILEPDYNLRITIDGIRRHKWLIGYCTQSDPSL